LPTLGRAKRDFPASYRKKSRQKAAISPLPHHPSAIRPLFPLIPPPLPHPPISPIPSRTAGTQPPPPSCLVARELRRHRHPPLPRHLTPRPLVLSSSLFLQTLAGPPEHNRRRRAARSPTSSVVPDIPLSLIAPWTYLAPSTSFSAQPNPNHRRIVCHRRTGSASPSSWVHRTGSCSPLTTTADEHLVAMVATRGQGRKRPAEQEQGKRVLCAITSLRSSAFYE